LKIGEKDANEEKKKKMSRRVITVKSFFLDKNNIKKTSHIAASLFVRYTEKCQKEGNLITGMV
jgi:hypothetical protein